MEVKDNNFTVCNDTTSYECKYMSAIRALAHDHSISTSLHLLLLGFLTSASKWSLSLFLFSEGNTTEPRVPLPADDVASDTNSTALYRLDFLMVDPIDKVRKKTWKWSSNSLVLPAVDTLSN